VAIGILVHQLPVGLSFAAVLLASGVGWRRMHLQAGMVASMIVVGALVVLAAADLSGSTLGALIGSAAGALIYIATGHLLPEAHREDRRLGVVVAFAVALIGTVFFVGAMHDDEHAGTTHAAAAAHVTD
jgi:zinc transporter ZupT